MVNVAPGGGNYTYAQLEGLWINAGGKKSLAPVMAAIAMAESGGNPNAKNPSGATGLWQILGAVNPADQAHLTDPATNAKEAVLKYKSQGLGAWTTYTSGAYKAFLNTSTSPNTNVPKPGSGSTQATTATLTSADVSQETTCLVGVPNPVNSIPIVGNFFSQNLVCLFTKTNARALIGGLLFVAGGASGLVGLAVLTAGVASGTKAGKGATDAVGAGAALVGAPEVGLAIAAAGRKGGLSSHARQVGSQRKATKQRTAQTASRDSKRQAERAARETKRQANTPKGKHSKTGANARPQGKHAAEAA